MLKKMRFWIGRCQFITMSNKAIWNWSMPQAVFDLMRHMPFRLRIRSVSKSIRFDSVDAKNDSVWFGRWCQKRLDSMRSMPEANRFDAVDARSDLIRSMSRHYGDWIRCRTVFQRRFDFIRSVPKAVRFDSVDAYCKSIGFSAACFFLTIWLRPCQSGRNET